MKTKIITLLSCAALAALSSTASAAVITYTATGFLIGSLGGVEFSPRAFTLRTTADTANIQFTAFTATTSFYTNLGETTIDIEGFETATFDGPQIGVYHQYDTTNRRFEATCGFVDLVQFIPIFELTHTENVGYDLATSTTFAGSPAIGANSVFSTTEGTLIMGQTGGAASFTAVTSVSAVPEPASVLGMVGLFAGGLLTRRRKTGR